MQRTQNCGESREGCFSIMGPIWGRVGVGMELCANHQKSEIRLGPILRLPGLELVRVAQRDRRFLVA